MYYYLSLGTNISPEVNAVKIVQHLCDNFGPMVLYPFIRTSPVDIQSENLFLNSVAIIKTDLKQTELKTKLDEIELSLGRDKADPLSASKDRTADIDILHGCHQLDLCAEIAEDIPYIHRVLALKPAVNLQHSGLPTIDRPTTVNIDSDSGQIVIATDKLNCL